MSSSNCCFLTWIQISQEAGQVVWCSQPFQNFPQFVVIHAVKGFAVVSGAKVDVFMKLSFFFNDPVDVGSLISGSSAFFKTSLNIWKLIPSSRDHACGMRNRVRHYWQLMVHVLLKPHLGNFRHYFASEWDEYNCATVWTFFGIAFLGDWNENWPFLVLWPLQSFSNLLAYWLQHLNSIIF